jgi:hypothetical protein
MIVFLPLSNSPADRLCLKSGYNLRAVARMAQPAKCTADENGPSPATCLYRFQILLAASALLEDSDLTGLLYMVNTRSYPKAVTPDFRILHHVAVSSLGTSGI